VFPHISPFFIPQPKIDMSPLRAGLFNTNFTPSLSRMQSTAVQRLCDGPAVKLSPIKFSAMQRSFTNETALTAGFTPRSTEQPVTPSYVPPSLRKADAVATPKSISSADMSSEQAFPTLGQDPKKKAWGPAAAGSWTHLRAKFAEKPETPLASPNPKLEQKENEYAALDEDAAPVTSSAPSPAISFKDAIKRNIKSEEEEEAANAIAIDHSIDDMAPEELCASGWGILPKKNKSAFAAGRYSPEVIDTEEEYFRNAEKYDGMTAVKDAMAEFTTSQGYLEAICRKGTAGDDPWLVHELVSEEVPVVPLRPQLPSDSPFLQLLKRKKDGLKAAAARLSELVS